MTETYYELIIRLISRYVVELQLIFSHFARLTILVSTSPTFINAMNQFEAFIQTNPFDKSMYTRPRKVVFLLDQVFRFEALDPKGFAERIVQSRSVAQAMSAALSETGSAVDQQMGATVTSDLTFEEVRRVAGQQFAILQATLGKGSAGLVAIFGHHITDYTSGLTHTNAVTKLPTLLRNLGANAAIAGPTAVDALTTAINAYLASHTDQSGEKGSVAQHRATAASFDPGLNQVLWQNQTAVVDRYPTAADQPQRIAAANYSLLQRPAAGPHAITYADFLAAGHTADVTAGSQLPLPAPATRLVLRNPGRVRLQVALSAALQPFPSSGAVQEMAPGTTLTLTLGALGDPAALPLLLVHNPTSELGQYEVVLG